MRQHHLINTVLGMIIASGIAGVGFAYTNDEVEIVVEEVVQEQLPIAEVVPEFAEPISGAHERVMKKPFGLHITPETSPVPNDRFSGYHVGVDFETFANESESDVVIRAMCEGSMLFKKRATGYGGMAAQGCVIEGKEVTVIYGHLRFDSVVVQDGVVLKPGDVIGVLGKGYSEETDGVRKHLHLGIREGRSKDIRGYVQDGEDIRGVWLDPMDYIPE